MGLLVSVLPVNCCSSQWPGQASHEGVVDSCRDHGRVKDVLFTLASAQGVNTIRNGVVFVGDQEVSLALRHEDHVRSLELGSLSLDIDRHATLCEQRDVVEVVDMALVAVARIDEVHLPQPEVAYAGQFGLGVAHA